MDMLVNIVVWLVFGYVFVAFAYIIGSTIAKKRVGTKEAFKWPMILIKKAMWK